MSHITLLCSNRALLNSGLMVCQGSLLHKHIHLLAKHKVLIRVMKGRRPHTNTSIIINCHRFGNLEAHLKKVQFKSSITSFFLTINVQLKGLEGGTHATKEIWFSSFSHQIPYPYNKCYHEICLPERVK